MAAGVSRQALGFGRHGRTAGQAGSCEARAIQKESRMNLFVVIAPSGAREITLAFVLIGIGLAHCTDLTSMVNETRSEVTFVCRAGKSINATFFPRVDSYVDLKLSDGRTLSVPHALSASGARYANADETFVFWNRGETAFITEGTSGQETYGGCVVK